MKENIIDPVCYLYLSLDPNSQVAMPTSLERRAFCSGYICSLQHLAKRHDGSASDIVSASLNGIIDLDLGEAEQINVILGNIRERVDDDFADYCARMYLDLTVDDCLLASAQSVQRAFLYGYQTAQCVTGEITRSFFERLDQVEGISVSQLQTRVNLMMEDLREAFRN